MKPSFTPLLLILSLTLALSACTPQRPSEPPAELIEIRMPVGYIPNVQFAPLYVAMEKGYFKDAGIELTLDYSFETDAVALVGANTLQFAVISGEQVPLGRAQGLPIVYVTAWYQKYPVGITVLADSGITKPEDLSGKRIGTPVLFGASYVGLRALLDAAGLRETDVTLDTIGYNQVEALIAKTEDAAVTYIANEPVQLAARGYDAFTISTADYIELVSNGLITNETTLKENPELVRKMVAALLHGMQDALDNPDEAFEISTRYVENLNQQADIQKQVMLASMELWKAERLGYSDPQAWQNMHDLLLKIGFLQKPLDDLDAAYSNDYLPEVSR